MNDSKQQGQATYSIGVAARMTGISAHKLRMWERRYQLSSSRRSKGGQREFTATDIDHLHLIKQLTDSGMRIGDIAKLPSKTLSTLLQDSQGGQVTPNKNRTFTAAVHGLTLTDYFRKHAKRFPRIIFSYDPLPIKDLVNKPPSKVESDLLIVQIDALTPEYASALQQLASSRTHVIVFYHYAAKPVKSILSGTNITLVSGGVSDPSQIDENVNKALMIQQHIEDINDNAHPLHLALPATKPKQFSEEDLIAAQQQANKLNCECPTHLTDLVRRLNAFEEYSRNCEVENWQQAAIHACIFTYTNQARHLIEQALQAVLDE